MPPRTQILEAFGLRGMGNSVPLYRRGIERRAAGAPTLG
jgi:hypothetical protein